nr:hypothetical protein [Tanacetum cinerariifolium]
EKEVSQKILKQEKDEAHKILERETTGLPKVGHVWYQFDEEEKSHDKDTYAYDEISWLLMRVSSGGGRGRIVSLDSRSHTHLDTLDVLNVGLLGDVIGEDDCDDDG